MKKPYIICLMACSIDGRIVFDNWSDEAPKTKYSELYSERHDSHETQGWILGRVSLEKDFSEGIKPDLIKPGQPIKREPFFGDKTAKTFAVTFDTKGTLGWNTNKIDGDHIIAVLVENVSDEYLYYLQHKNISYIFAGKQQADLKLAMAQLSELFSIEKIMLEGGGYLNGSFLNEGLIDEISLLLLPIADGTPNAPTVFEVNPRFKKNPSTLLHLKTARQLENGVLWLQYTINVR
jgi:riboflavin biosynthesis pyrimidine reductase